DFTYFALLLYVAVPTVILGLFGRAGWRWALLITTAMLVAQYQDVLRLRAHFPVREIWLVLAFALWQWVSLPAFAGTGARAGWLAIVQCARCMPAIPRNSGRHSARLA